MNVDRRLTEQPIVILGAGVAGLASALALHRLDPNRPLTLIDQEHAPPEGPVEQAFATWSRKGASQFHHSHIFISRLFVLLRDQYPDLLTALYAAGAAELTFAETLPVKLRKSYTPTKADRDLSLLSCRRATFEAVVRQYVSALDNVSILPGTVFQDLVMEDRRVTGITVRSRESTDLRTIDSHVLIDACGRLSPCFDQLVAHGCPVSAEETTSGILYYTRHYRLHPGQTVPTPGPYPMAADDGYLKYGIFHGDNGYFSLILCCRENESALRRHMLNPDFFDRIIRMLPATAPWIEPERSAPVSRVHAMGSLVSHWRHFLDQGNASVEGYFAVGDSHIRSNPRFGRGCTMAFLMAEALAAALNRHRDLSRALRYYEHRIARELRPYYDEMVIQDRRAIAHAQPSMNRKPNRPQDRLMQHIASAGVMQSIRTDSGCFRDAMRSFLMLDPPLNWARKPRNVSIILGNSLLRPRGGKVIHRAIPHREVLLRDLGLAEFNEAIRESR